MSGALTALATVLRVLPEAEVVTPTLPEAAVELAVRGWPVHPLLPRSKKPASAHGKDDATTDPAVVATWWAAQPDCNIGIAVPRGYVVIDDDPRNGAARTLEELQVKAGALPPTLTALSGRGEGLHRWYRAPSGELRGELGPGLDVKLGGAGYVVAPPSLHPDTGQPYRWLELAPIAALPWSWAALLRKAPPKQRVYTGQAAGGGPVTALVRSVANATQGERNRLLFWAACRLAEKALDPAEYADAEAQLEAAAVGAGLTQGEVRATLRSARTRGGAA
jgi:hypothetical protein